MGAGCPVGWAEPASTPTLSEARDVLTARRDARLAAETRLGELVSDLANLDRSIASASDASAQLSASIESARAELRAAATNAFVDGGDTDPMLAYLSDWDLLVTSRRLTFLEHRAGDLADASSQFEAMKRDNDPKLVAMAEARESLTARVTVAENALAQANATEADAERALTAAEAKATADAAERAARAARAQPAGGAGAATSAASSPRPAPAAPNRNDPQPAAIPTTTTPRAVVATDAPSAPLPELPEGGPTPEQWAALRQCESSGNYRAVSASGRYRGAYQMDAGTWASLGGLGDPAAAPPIEQDARARLLHLRRGWKPWPHCGRHLQ